MKTVNSLSGGKTSSYIAAKYPADYNLFSLVRTSDKNCLFPDKKLRQVVSDKLGGVEFIGTLEEDTIIYTMLDLEQYIGSEINWLTGITYDELVYKNKKVNMPDAKKRSCTSELKITPIQKFWYDNIKVPVEMRIGFRANETNRAITALKKTNKDGFTESNIIVGKREGNKVWKNKWQKIAWRKPTFPLIEDNIYKDNIESYWEGKNVRFSYMNNCVGCFNRNPVLLKLMSDKFPNKFNWFNEVEKNSLKYKNMTWIEGVSYEEIRRSFSQIKLFDDDFDSCDSGYCGI